MGHLRGAGDGAGTGRKADESTGRRGKLPRVLLLWELVVFSAPSPSRQRRESRWKGTSSLWRKEEKPKGGGVGRGGIKRGLGGVRRDGTAGNMR